MNTPESREETIQEICNDCRFGEHTLHEWMNSLPEDHPLYKMIFDHLALESLQDVSIRMDEPVPAEISQDLGDSAERLADALAEAQKSGELPERIF